jgi:hypothetical protein
MSYIVVVTTRSPWVEVSNVGKSVTESGCRLQWYSSSPLSQIGGGPSSWIADRGSTHQTPESYWWRCCRASADNSVVEATLVVAWCRCWVVLVMTLPMRLGYNTMSMSSHTDDCAAESYWQWHCRGDVSCDMMSPPIGLGGRATSWWKTEWLPRLSAVILQQKFFLYKMHTHMVRACLIREQESRGRPSIQGHSANA